MMQYSPFASDIELPFYTALASHKINNDKLNDSARSVLGLYEIRSTDPANASCRMQIHGNALTSNESDKSHMNLVDSGADQVDRAPAGFYRAEGMIKNVNTIEEYRNMDKSQMINQAGRTVRSVHYECTPEQSLTYDPDLGCNQRRHYLLLPFIAGIIHRSLICGP